MDRLKAANVRLISTAESPRSQVPPEAADFFAASMTPEPALPGAMHPGEEPDDLLAEL